MRYKMFSIHYDRTFKKQTNCVQLAVQLLSRVQLCDPMDCSMPGSSLLQYLTEFAQIHVHWIGDAIPPSNPLLLLLPSIFPSIQVFASGGWSIVDSRSASVLPMNIQGWFPLGLTGLISLQSKGLLRVFSSTTFQKPQFKKSVLWYSAFFMGKAAMCACSVVSDSVTLWTVACQAPLSIAFSRLPGVGCHFLLQEKAELRLNISIV